MAAADAGKCVECPEVTSVELIILITRRDFFFYYVNALMMHRIYDDDRIVGSDICRCYVRADDYTRSARGGKIS